MAAKMVVPLVVSMAAKSAVLLAAPMAAQRVWRWAACSADRSDCQKADEMVEGTAAQKVETSDSERAELTADWMAWRKAGQTVACSAAPSVEKLAAMRVESLVAS